MDQSEIINSLLKLLSGIGTFIFACEVLSENLKWDVAIVRNEVAMVSYIIINVCIPTKVRSSTLLILSAVRRRRDFLEGGQV